MSSWADYELDATPAASAAPAPAPAAARASASETRGTIVINGRQVQTTFQSKVGKVDESARNGNPKRQQKPVKKTDDDGLRDCPSGKVTASFVVYRIKEMFSLAGTELDLEGGAFSRACNAVWAFMSDKNRNFLNKVLHDLSQSYATDAVEVAIHTGEQISDRFLTFTLNANAVPADDFQTMFASFVQLWAQGLYHVVYADRDMRSSINNDPFYTAVYKVNTKHIESHDDLFTFIHAFAGEINRNAYACISDAAIREKTTLRIQTDSRSAVNAAPEDPDELLIILTSSTKRGLLAHMSMLRLYISCLAAHDSNSQKGDMKSRCAAVSAKIEKFNLALVHSVENNAIRSLYKWFQNFEVTPVQADGLPRLIPPSSGPIVAAVDRAFDRLRISVSFVANNDNHGYTTLLYTSCGTGFASTAPKHAEPKKSAEFVNDAVSPADAARVPTKSAVGSYAHAAAKQTETTATVVTATAAVPSSAPIPTPTQAPAQAPTPGFVTLTSSKPVPQSAASAETKTVVSAILVQLEAIYAVLRTICQTDVSPSLSMHAAAATKALILARRDVSVFAATAGLDVFTDAQQTPSDLESNYFLLGDYISTLGRDLHSMSKQLLGDDAAKLAPRLNEVSTSCIMLGGECQAVFYE